MSDHVTDLDRIRDDALEAKREASFPASPTAHARRRHRINCSPEAVVAWMDELEALREVKEAARAVVAGSWTPSHDTIRDLRAALAKCEQEARTGR